MHSVQAKISKETCLKGCSKMSVIDYSIYLLDTKNVFINFYSKMNNINNIASVKGAHLKGACL